MRALKKEPADSPFIKQEVMAIYEPQGLNSLQDHTWAWLSAYMRLPQTWHPRHPEQVFLNTLNNPDSELILAHVAEDFDLTSLLKAAQTIRVGEGDRKETLT